MPNYTWNYISANPDTIVKMKKKYYASEERPFDFNKLVPMPESLDVESGSSNDLDIYYYLSEKLSIPVEEMKKHSLTMLLLSNHFSTEWIDEIYKRIVKRIKAGEYPNYETGRTLVDNWKKYAGMNGVIKTGELNGMLLKFVGMKIQLNLQLPGGRQNQFSKRCVKTSPVPSYCSHANTKKVIRLSMKSKTGN